MSSNGSADRILIAGAGPVGTITALALAQQGIPVTVFDALDYIPADHRASTIHPSTMEMLEPLGMTQPMLERGIESPHFQFRDRATQEIVAEFDYGELSDELSYPLALQLEQHKTIAIGRDIAAPLPEFELLQQHEVVDVSQDADEVTATVQLPDGSKQTFDGRYLVGCDGGRSTVRKAQDIDFPGMTWEERFCIVSTHYDFGTADGFRYRNYMAHPEQWSALIKVPGEDDEGIWRCLFPAFGDDPDEVITSDDWIQARFAECFPYDPPYKIVHRNLYSVHQRVAETFAKGRVVLAGDAAHVNNPLGGMGMNSGIHDGINAAEKLGQIWRGEADEDILARYDRQRRPTAKKYVQAQSIQNKKMLEENDPVERRKRLDELRETAEDKEKLRAYLRRVSLVAMVEEANSIT